MYVMSTCEYVHVHILDTHAQAGLMCESDEAAQHGWLVRSYAWDTCLSKLLN